MEFWPNLSCPWLWSSGLSNFRLRLGRLFYGSLLILKLIFVSVVLGVLALWYGILLPTMCLGIFFYANLGFVLLCFAYLSSTSVRTKNIRWAVLALPMLEWPVEICARLTLPMFLVHFVTSLGVRLRLLCWGRPCSGSNEPCCGNGLPQVRIFWLASVTLGSVALRNKYGVFG